MQPGWGSLVQARRSPVAGNNGGSSVLQSVIHPPHAGYYELELELHEIVGGDNVNQVVRARLGFVTAEGLEFFADKVCVLEETDREIAPP